MYVLRKLKREINDMQIDTDTYSYSTDNIVVILHSTYMRNSLFEITLSSN